MPLFLSETRIRRIVGGKIARGSVWALSARIGALGLGFLQSILMARMLGPEGYGTAALVISFSVVVGTVAALGLNKLAVREVARLDYREELPLLRTFLVWSAIGVFGSAIACGAAVAGVGRLEFGPPQLSWGLALVPLTAFLLLCRGIAQGFGAVPASLAPLDIIRPAIIAVGFGFFWSKGWDPDVFNALTVVTCAHALAFGAAAIFLLPHLRRLAGVTTVGIRASHWLGGSISFLAIGILAALQAELTTILIGFLSSERETGLFLPAFRLATVLLVARQAIEVPLAPRISQLWDRGDLEELRKLLRRASRYAFFVALGLWIILLIAGKFLLSIFGVEYIYSAPALYIIATTNLFSVACGPIGTVLNMIGHQAATVRALSLALLVNVFLGSWLIPEGGALGGAISLSAGIMVWSAVLLIEAKKRLGFAPTILTAGLSRATSH